MHRFLCIVLNRFYYRNRDYSNIRMHCYIFGHFRTLQMHYERSVKMYILQGIQTSKLEFKTMFWSRSRSSIRIGSSNSILRKTIFNLKWCRVMPRESPYTRIGENAKTKKQKQQRTVIMLMPSRWHCHNYAVTVTYAGAHLPTSTTLKVYWSNWKLSVCRIRPSTSDALAQLHDCMNSDEICILYHVIMSASALTSIRILMQIELKTIWKLIAYSNTLGDGSIINRGLTLGSLCSWINQSDSDSNSAFKYKDTYVAYK